MSDLPIGPEEFDALQSETFEYFVKEANPRNGLIADKTQPGAPASIAAVGLALSSYPIGRSAQIHGPGRRRAEDACDAPVF